VSGEDYYDIIGLKRGASQEDIQKAFRSLARKYHPDVNKKAGSEERFKEICEAYDVLKDPEKRKQYDRFGKNWEQMSQASHGCGGGGSHFGSQSDGNSFRNMDDIFGSLFGGGGRGAPNFFGSNTSNPQFSKQKKAEQHEVKLSITLEEGYHGGVRNISIGSRMHGSPSKNIQVKIPIGVADGTRIRLSGQGQAGSLAGISGDIYLKIHILPHPVFKQDGHDLVVEVPVTPWELALGGQITVPTLDKPLKVNIQPGTQGGQKLRLQGKGYPSKGGAMGNLIVQIKAAIPKELSSIERELFEKLAAHSDFNPRQADTQQ